MNVVIGDRVTRKKQQIISSVVVNFYLGNACSQLWVPSSTLPNPLALDAPFPATLDVDLGGVLDHQKIFEMLYFAVGEF